MSNTEHTPTPWKVFTSPDGLKLVGIGSVEGEGICDAGFGVWRWNDAEGVQNADLIVRAVNSHADMLAALKSVRQELWVDYCLEKGRTDIAPDEFNARPHIRIIDTAVAKAERLVAD